MSRLQLRLLGGFQLLSAEGNPITVPTRKAKGLLAYLGFHPGQPHQRAKLASLFWEDSDDSQARESLRTALALMRRAIPLPADQWITTNNEDVTVGASQVDVDVHRLLSAVRSGHPSDLQEVAELYRGEFMDGFAIRSCSGFENWLSTTRRVLNKEALTSLSKLLSIHMRNHQLDQAAVVAAKILQIEPAREEVHRQLMEIYSLQGRYTEALQQYQTCVRMTKDLDVQPDPATKALHKKIREQRNKAAEKASEDKPSNLSLRPKQAPIIDHNRRHITVLSAELIGIDDQLEELGPDRLLATAKAFFDKGSEIVAKFGGVPGRFSGNCFPAYFGYPKADEHSAECAVRAGLALVKEIAEQNDATGPKFRVRAGVAAGQVLISNFGSEADEPVPTFIGEAPKNAALLQSLAGPETILITGKLRRTLNTLFEYEVFTPPTGLPWKDLNPCQVLREDPNAGRFDALRGTTNVKFVGRKTELKRILADWRIAEAGEGRLALIAGEAGMGKSRLARGLEDRLSDEPHLTLRYQCSPFYSNTPLHPLIHWIERAAGFGPDDDASPKRLKLLRLLSEGSPPSSHNLPVYAALLGIGDPQILPPQSSTPAQQLRRTLAVILTHMEMMSREQPLLVIVEDLHWADATSLELINLMVERIQHLPIMVVMTSRPGLEAPWCGLDHASRIELAGLSPDEAKEMVTDICRDAPLPSSTIDHILSKADGIPLFIEELSKVALEKREQRAGSFSPNLPIPSTLEDSLLARLDAQGAGKELAQIAAVIGREFSIDLLSQIAETPGREIEGELSKLVDADLIFKTRSGFAFRHVLLQDAAYDSLSPRRREQLHRSVAAALLPSSSKSKPELLAHHYSAACMGAEALHFWFEAGKQAAERSANREAIGHIDRGLRLLEDALDMADEERQDRKLRFLVLKGPCVMSLHGYGAEESREVCEKAHKLIGKSTQVAAKIQILGGLWGVHFHRSEIANALAIARELDGLSSSSGAGIDAANCMMGQTLCAAGEFVEARRHFQKVVNSHRRHCARTPGFFAVEEPVLALTYLSRVLWTLGYLEQAGVAIGEAIEAARLGANSASVATALLGQISMESHNVPLKRAIAQAEEGMAFCADQELWLFEHWFRFHYGGLIAKQGDIAKGIEIMESAIAAAGMKNSLHSRPLQLAFVGVAYAMQSEPETALTRLDRALQLAARTGERQSEAKIRRMLGDLLLRLDRRADAQVELQQAFRVANAQNARLEELRVAMTLTKYRLVLEDGTEGRNALSRVYASFTEGHGFADLKAARAQLEAGR